MRVWTTSSTASPCWILKLLRLPNGTSKSYKKIPIREIHFKTTFLKSLEEKKVCRALFLDVAQAFNKVWHEGLNHKLKSFSLPNIHHLGIPRYLKILQEDAYSDLRKTQAGMPQGSVLRPDCYLLDTGELSTSKENLFATQYISINK